MEQKLTIYIWLVRERSWYSLEVSDQAVFAVLKKKLGEILQISLDETSVFSYPEEKAVRLYQPLKELGVKDGMSFLFL
jgi:hypothetical protein